MLKLFFCVLGLGGILQSAPVDWLVKTCIMYNLWDVYLLNWILCLHIIYTWLSCFIYILCTENLLGRLQQMMVPVPVSFALWIDESNGKYQWDWPLLLIFLYTVGTQTDERSRRYSAVGRPRLEESNRIACWSHWLHPHHRDFHCYHSHYDHQDDTYCLFVVSLGVLYLRVRFGSRQRCV